MKYKYSFKKLCSRFFNFLLSRKEHSAMTIPDFIEIAIKEAKHTINKINKDDLDAHQNFVLSMLDVLHAYAETALKAWQQDALLAIPLLTRSILETHVELLLTIKDPAHYINMKEKQARANKETFKVMSERRNLENSNVDWESMHKMLNQLLKDQGKELKSIQNQFKEVKFTEIYDTLYRQLSKYTHPSLSLMRDIRNGSVNSQQYHKIFLRRIAKDLWHATNQTFIFCGYPVLQHSKNFILLKPSYKNAINQ